MLAGYCAHTPTLDEFGSWNYFANGEAMNPCLRSAFWYQFQVLGKNNVLWHMVSDEPSSLTQTKDSESYRGRISANEYWSISR